MTVTDLLTKLSYQTFQQSKTSFGLAHKTLSSQLRNWIAPLPPGQTKRVSPEAIDRLRQRLSQLLDVDWQDAERGVYPTHVLFDNPWDEFFAYYPWLCLDMPRTWIRAQNRQYRDLPSDCDRQNYPDYYLQNFHYQTDGYLSEQSANLYDLQVDILFNGAADAMRRRVLAPLKRGLETFKNAGTAQLRLLDVACGTGRTLKFLRETFPKASLVGTDLSAAYLRKADRLLSQQPGELPQLIRANAEELPFVENYFHGIACVFLFHELPAPVRGRIIEQCYRVLQPGGVLAICDSIQLSDSPEFSAIMENFTLTFHEPFYQNYIADNIEVRLEAAEFTDIATEVHFMSKYWIARKPR
jgi:ubiquinone/menaquinone biosynthesis C-methylase UbiE